VIVLEKSKLKMTESHRIRGLAEQIKLAQKYLDQWPEWLRSNAHFSGPNHSGDATPDSSEQISDIADVP